MSNDTPKQKHTGNLGRWALGRDTIGNYMRRWFFWCPWFGIRIHHILRSDKGKDLHDHPWDFASFLLTGGYWEVTPFDPTGYPVLHHRYRPRFSLVRHKAEDLHRLVLSEPVWTLVFTGPKRKSWSFLTEQGMVPWREYLGEEEGR